MTRMRCCVPLVLGLALSATSATAAPAHKPHPRAHHAAPHHHHFVGAASPTDTMTLSSPSGSGSQLASSPSVAASLAMATPPPPSAPRASVRLEAAPAHDDADVGPPPPPAVVAAPRAALTVTPVDNAASSGRERRWGLIGGGLALFLGGYALDIGISYGVGHTGAAESLIPIVGPLVQLNQSWAMVAPANTGNADVDAQANSRIASANHAIQVAAYAVLSVDFALQLAGAAMTIVGAVGHAPRRFAAVTKGVAWNFAPNGVRLRF